MTDDDPAPHAAMLLDVLPYGVIALDHSGTVLRCNAAACALVPGLDTPAGLLRCSDLFACQSPDGPCMRSCFVARTAGSTQVSDEVRIDTPGGVLPGALWVTGSPLPDGGGALLHLRPGRRGDRRRRSDARWQTVPELSIRVLGRTRVEALEDSLDTSWLGQRPGLVLKYLLCERARVVAVDEIAEAIWPDSTRSAVANARFAIHRLRGKLEPRRDAHVPPAFVISSGSGYALDRDRIWIDADEFEHAVEDGRAAMSRLDPSAARQYLETAVGLYRGVFLADEPYAHWAADERNRLQGLATYALRVLTALARERGDHTSALRHLQQLAQLEPLDSAVHRELIQTLLSQGLRSDAKRRYDSFAHRIRRELVEEPDFDIRTLPAAPAHTAP